MLAADENAIVYSIGSHGFMRYNNETGEIDQLFGSEGFTFQTMLQGVVAARVVNETELFLATRTSGGGKVLRYVYDADKPDTRPNTLRVYALRGSETLKLAEQVFEARYQDTNMVLETYFAPPALSDVPAAPDIAARPAATDIDEAAEQLITRVLAGEGPDVIIMDDLPYSAYARQGLFEDVADLAESSGVAVFITDSLRDENGKLPLVPSHFSFPVLLGDLEDNTPNSLDELVNGVLARPTFTQAFPDWQLVTLEESDRPQVHFNTLDEISIVLLRANLSAVLPGMTRVDGENVEKLLLAVQRVAQHYDLQNQPNMGMPLYGIYVEYLFTDRYMPSGVTAMAQGGAGQYWGKMDTFQLLRTVYSGRPIIPYPPGTSKRENYKSGFYGAALPTLAQAVYTPINLMGINVDANNKEGARAFVELMLSKEMQTPNLYEGLPVTMAAMEQQYDDAMRINDMFSLEDAVLEPEEEVIFNYEAIFAELEYPYEYFPALEDAFIQQAQLYCTGAITIQQAVSEIESAMELYLQERYNG